MMKKTFRPGPGCYAGLLAACFCVLGCGVDSGSVEETIEDFRSAINRGDFDAAQDCMADDNTVSLDESWADAYFPDTPYSVSDYDETGNSATVAFKSESGSVLVYYFEMDASPGAPFETAYYIKRIRIGDDAGSLIFY
jgi:hypothetical protein